MIWIFEHLIEIIASILGLIGIFLQIKQNSWYWLISILMVILYIHVFYESKFYADMTFQFYYLGISIYGWIYWIKDRKKYNVSQKKIKIIAKKLNFKQIIFSIVISLFFWIIIYFILKKFTDSDVTIGDSFTTALSIVATFLLARKFIENWLFWIIVDFVSTILYISKELYPTALLFSVLTILAFVGFFKWRKNWFYNVLCG